MLFRSYRYMDILDMAHSVLSSISTERITRMIRVKYREFQERLLDEILKLISDMPDEEMYTFMEYCKKNRDNTNKLSSIIMEMEDEEKRNEVIEMTTLKCDILKEFMPDILESTYKPFYDNSEEKEMIVNDILRLTKSHSKAHLKSLSMDTLNNLRNSILEQNRADAEKRQKFKKIVNIFNSTLVASDNDNFVNACITAQKELDEGQLLDLINHMSAINPFFISNFNSALKDYKKIR